VSKVPPIPEGLRLKPKPEVRIMPQAAPETPTAPDHPPAWGGADLGIHLMVCVGVAGVTGYGLDIWLGTLPWLALLGCICGFGAWLRTMWRVFQKA
jgi:hypothetical protein